MFPLTNWTGFSTTRSAARLIAVALIFFCAAGTAPAGELLPRKVLILYDSSVGQSAVVNDVFDMGQSVLNYYGLVVEYRDVTVRPLPGPEEMTGMRGIVSWFQTNKMEGAGEYLAWLENQLERGIRLVVLGELGGTAGVGDVPGLKEKIDRIFARLGLLREGWLSIDQRVIRYGFKDPAMVEFERRYPPLPKLYQKYTATGPETTKWLTLTRTDLPDSESAVVVTNGSGGYALEGFIYWIDPISFRKQWYLNPFRFYSEAFALDALPVPDPTTLNGARVAFSHIDGDAFSGFTRVDRNSNCAEILKREILEKYDFPVTVSVIVAEIDPRIHGRPEYVDLAREIFRLPNVEPASHSFSHPFYWDPNSRTKDSYPRRQGVPVPGYTCDPAREINFSCTYITENLCPKGKECRVLLWSGDCEPMESDIARCDALGVFNMNGGDTLFDGYNDSYASVGPLYRRVGERYQIHCGQANENILTNLWTGPYYGHRNIITTMERTENPRRIAPIDIYYHFYSGEYPASVKALQDIYEWVLAQDVAPLFVSGYAGMVCSSLKTRIYADGPGRYRIADYGDCLTMRFDPDAPAPDPGRCTNVLGYTREPQGLYVSLLPGRDEACIVLGGTPGPDLNLTRASGRVSNWRKRGTTVTLDFHGHGAGTLLLGGCVPGGEFNVAGSAVKGEVRRVKSDSGGVVTIEGLVTGTLEVDKR